MNRIGTRELKTERLTLRKLRESDAEDLFTICGLGKNLEEARNLLATMAQYSDDPLNYHWVLVYDGHAVGRIRAWELNPEQDYAQLGYEIGEKYRSKGLMTEALRAVIAYLAKDAGLNHIYCLVREENIASRRVCEKAGMTHEGNMRKHFKRADGTYIDARIYGILSSEI